MNATSPASSIHARVRADHRSAITSTRTWRSAFAPYESPIMKPIA
jgi:hypothetical protein